jgi:hypothetical protein
MILYNGERAYSVNQNWYFAGLIVVMFMTGKDGLDNTIVVSIRLYEGVIFKVSLPQNYIKKITSLTA